MLRASGAKPYLILSALLIGGCADRQEQGDVMKDRSYPAVAHLSPRPVLLTRGATTVYHGGYGSGFARHPTDSGRFYLLTDRGPNYEMPQEDHKTFPDPSYTPTIGLFHLQDSVLTLETTITLKNAHGRALSGIPMPPGKGGTGETALDTLGTVIPFDSLGIDAEGLAAMGDGTFWVTDEYGPGLLHVDADGRTLERISPRTGEGRALPAVLGRRRPNRGFEGLAVTRDQRLLVAVLEAPLDNPKSAGRASRINRILTLDLESGQFQQFAYVLENAGVTTNGLSAVGGNQFLVLERDDKFPGDTDDPSTFKRVYRIDLTGATDLSDSSNAPAGRLFGGKTLEELTVEELAAAGIVPVSKSLVVDLLAPELAYPHNKPEGVAIINRFTLAVSNDDDFGIWDDGKGGIVTKVLPLTGQPDQTTVRFIPVREPLY